MDLRKFLNKIAQLESTNDFNTQHKKMQYGIHKGDSAIGKYGLMPNTIDEFISRREAKKKYGPDEALIDRLEGAELKDFISGDKRIEDNLANDIAKHVLSRSKDEEKAAYMWNQGHNKNPNDITEEDLDQSDYVQKFRNLNDLLNK